jgi:hypothetical protein
MQTELQANRRASSSGTLVGEPLNEPLLFAFPLRVPEVRDDDGFGRLVNESRVSGEDHVGKARLILYESDIAAMFDDPVV